LAGRGQSPPASFCGRGGSATRKPTLAAGEPGGPGWGASPGNRYRPRHRETKHRVKRQLPAKGNRCLPETLNSVAPGLSWTFKLFQRAPAAEVIGAAAGPNSPHAHRNRPNKTRRKPERAENASAIWTWRAGKGGRDRPGNPPSRLGTASPKFFFHRRASPTFVRTRPTATSIRWCWGFARATPYAGWLNSEGCSGR